jgi:hypothetical protein
MTAASCVNSARGYELHSLQRASAISPSSRFVAVHLNAGIFLKISCDFAACFAGLLQEPDGLHVLNKHDAKPNLIPCRLEQKCLEMLAAKRYGTRRERAAVRDIRC